MKNRIVLLIIMSFLVLQIQAQTRDDIAKSARPQIQALLDNTYGDQFHLSRIEYIDDSIFDGLHTYRYITDPYGTLKGSFIFHAVPQMITDSGAIGIVKDGQIRWFKRVYDYVRGGELFASLDLNEDGQVDLVSTWDEVTSSARTSSWSVSVFSWDGTTARQLHSDTSYLGVLTQSLSVSDINGDGIWELIGSEWANEEQMRPVVISWNGSEFGVWKDGPSYDGSTYSLAKNFTATIRCNVEQVENALQYRYEIRNDAASKQGIREISFTHRTTLGKLTPVVKPHLAAFQHIPPEIRPGWSLRMRAVDFPLFYFVTSHLAFEIKPGKTEDGLSFRTSALPMISRFYLQAAHRTPNETTDPIVERQRYLQDILENSFQTTSLGPADPPNPFVPIAFVDTIASYKHQAHELGWIKNQGVVTSLDQKLENAKTQLQRGNSSSARNILESFINEVEALNKQGDQLTSEAYALLKFNAEYLVERIR